MAWFRAELEHKEFAAPFAAPAGVAQKLVLMGRIVAMDGPANVFDDGMLCIDGQSIVYAGKRQPLPPAFAGAPVVETGGTMYPGLFELHNHPSYNAIPLWEVPEQYPNRKQWRDDKRYKRKVSIPSSLLTHDPTSENARSVIRFVECRALLGGVTSTQGLSIAFMDAGTKDSYRGLVRNLELPDDPAWPAAEDQINDFTSSDDAKKKYGPFLNDSSHPYLMHLGEGTDGPAHDVLNFLKQVDGTWLVGKNLVGIHATGLDAAQFGVLKAAAGIVWSPLSNLLLYGATTKVEAAVAAGVPIALGSDWAPSGTKNLLGELKIAKIASTHQGGLFSDLDLVRMVTSVPAGMMGWGKFLGSLESDRLADILILDGRRGDPYGRLISATEADIVAVIIGGRPRAGRASVIDPRTPGVEMLRVASQDTVLDIVESPTHPLANTKLGSAISTLTYSLEHLPDLAENFLAHHQYMSGAPDRFAVHLDLDEDYAVALTTGAAKIGRGDVDPMELDPITSVDDATFRSRLIANKNIPDWLRKAL